MLAPMHLPGHNFSPIGWPGRPESDITTRSMTKITAMARSRCQTAHVRIIRITSIRIDENVIQQSALFSDVPSATTMPYDAASTGKPETDILKRPLLGLTSADLQGYLTELRRIISLR